MKEVGLSPGILAIKIMPKVFFDNISQYKSNKKGNNSSLI